MTSDRYKKQWLNMMIATETFYLEISLWTATMIGKKMLLTLQDFSLFFNNFLRLELLDMGTVLWIISV